MPITISYGNPALVGAASFAVGREKGRLKAGAQAAKFAQGMLDRRDREQDQEQDRRDRLGVIGAQMNQRERFEQQRIAEDQEQRFQKSQIAAGRIRSEMTQGAANRQAAAEAAAAEAQAEEMKRQQKLQDEAREFERKKEFEQYKHDLENRGGGSKFFGGGSGGGSDSGGVFEPGSPAYEQWASGGGSDAVLRYDLSTGQPDLRPRKHTPDQVRQQNRLNMFKGKVDQQPHLSAEQKQHARFLIDQEMSNIVPPEIPEGQEPVPISSLVGKSLMNANAYQDLPWTIGSDGTPQLPRGFTPPKPEWERLSDAKIDLTKSLAQPSIGENGQVTMPDGDKIKETVDKLFGGHEGFSEGKGGVFASKPMHKADATFIANNLKGQGMENVSVTPHGNQAIVQATPAPAPPSDEEQPISMREYVDDKDRRLEIKNSDQYASMNNGNGPTEDEVSQILRNQHHEYDFNFRVPGADEITDQAMADSTSSPLNTAGGFAQPGARVEVDSGELREKPFVRADQPAFPPEMRGAPPASQSPVQPAVQEKQNFYKKKYGDDPSKWTSQQRKDYIKDVLGR